MPLLAQYPGLMGVYCFAFKMKCGVYTRPQITYTENNTCAHSVSECVVLVAWRDTEKMAERVFRMVYTHARTHSLLARTNE